MEQMNYPLSADARTNFLHDRGDGANRPERTRGTAMRWSVGAALIVALLQGAPEAKQEVQPGARGATGPEDGGGPFLAKYCARCHGPEKPKGNFTLPGSGAAEGARIQ